MSDAALARQQSSTQYEVVSQKGVMDGLRANYQLLS